jgi:hypothetical protein
VPFSCFFFALLLNMKVDHFYWLSDCEIIPDARSL